MRSNARTPRPNPARSFFFRPAHLRSTCSKVMPTAATSFARSCKLSLNEKEVQNAKTVQIEAEKTSRHCGAPAAPHDRERGGLRRHCRAKHETFAGLVDRAAAAHCCG